MFSGLNNFIKYILPKRLFYRALIIVAAPTIILQVIITIVFYDSVWIKANKNITRSLVNQLKTIEEVYQNDKKNKIDLKSKHRVGVAEIDLNKMVVDLNNKSKKINNTEKKVLIEMLANPGVIFSREEIGRVSGIIQERSIDVMITRLRQKLELDSKNPKYLQTIRGSGYVLWVE